MTECLHLNRLIFSSTLGFLRTIRKLLVAGKQKEPRKHGH